MFQTIGKTKNLFIFSKIDSVPDSPRIMVL